MAYSSAIKPGGRSTPGRYRVQLRRQVQCLIPRHSWQLSRDIVNADAPTVTDSSSCRRWAADGCGGVNAGGANGAAGAGWAGAVDMNGDATVFGTYRGVFIRSNSDLGRQNDAVKLFNDEVAKLEAA
jgi:hypothetical protein